MRSTKAKKTVIKFSILVMTAFTLAGNGELNPQQTEVRSKGDVPEDIAYAANFLRSQGVDDPSQGVYQEAVIVCPNISGLRLRETDIKGWVFPAGSDGEQKVLAWNGLTYDVIILGDKADLLSDVRDQRSSSYPSTRRSHPEVATLSNIAGPVPSCLLAMLGEGELAEEVLQRASSSYTINNIKTTALSHYDAVLMDAIASRIAVAEDFSALHLARKLKRFRQVRGKYPPLAGRIDLSVQVDELQYVDTMIEDLKLRLASNDEDRLSLEEIGLLQQKEQVPLLIDLLSEMGRLASIPGARDTPSTAYKMLREIGDGSIDGLIASLEDQRMTRSFGRSSGYSRADRFRTVGEVCGQLIVHSWGFGAFRKPDGSYDAALIKHIWERTRGFTREERWIYTLHDDELHSEIWRIVASILGRTRLGTRGTNAANSDHRLPIGPVVQLDYLFDSSRAEVTAALLTRAEAQFNKLYPRPGGIETEDYGRASECAIAAAVWDIDAAIPILKRILDAQFDYVQRVSSGNISARPFPVVASALIYGGEDVWDTYESMLEKIKLSGSFKLELLLMPIWQHPEHPLSKQLAEKLFLSDGPWHARNSLELVGGRASIMLYHPAYLKSVREALDDTRTASLVTRTSENRVQVNLRGTISSKANQDPDFLKNVGDTLGIRYCDLVVHALYRTFDLRGYDLLLPHEEKDRYVAKIKEFIDSGADWTTVQESVRPQVRGYDPLFCTAPIWPDYSKND